MLLLKNPHFLPNHYGTLTKEVLMSTSDFGKVIIQLYVCYLNSQNQQFDHTRNNIKVKFTTASLYTVSLYDEFKIDPPLSTTLRS